MCKEPFLSRAIGAGICFLWVLGVLVTLWILVYLPEWWNYMRGKQT